MSIQSSINQLIATASLGAGLFMHSNTGKSIMATREAKKGEKLRKNLQESIKKNSSKDNEVREQLNEVQKDILKNKKAAATYSPTEKRENAYIEELKRQKENSNPLEMKSDQANLRMIQKGNQKITQKRKYRNFLDYIKEEPVSLGNELGKYNQELLKQYASTFTPAQRKKYMDEKDAEKLRGRKK